MQGKVEICGINTSKLKVLSQKEMDALLRRCRDGDEMARQELIEGNLRLVLSVIQRFDKRGESPDDLFQVGCIGLIKAISNFDPDKQVRFSTYGVPMIAGEVRRYLRDNSAIRVSRSIRDVAYRVLLGEENPTWLYSVNQGATTIWERYDSYTKEKGFADAAMNSFNHFNEGSVAQGMYESMLGIRVDLTGQEPIVIAPQIPQEDIAISQVKGSYHSVFGTVEVEWEKLGEGEVRVGVSAPENVDIRVKLPLEGMEDMLMEGGRYEWKGKYKLLE